MLCGVDQAHTDWFLVRNTGYIPMGVYGDYIP